MNATARPGRGVYVVERMRQNIALQSCTTNMICAIACRLLAMLKCKQRRRRSTQMKLTATINSPVK